MAISHSIGSLPPLPTVEDVEFRLVQGYDWYCIGSDGSVWTCSRGTPRRIGLVWKRMKPSASPRYFSISLWKAGAFKRRMIHHLVLEHFVGPRPDGMLALYSDDDPKNNALSNLRWGTRRENTEDAIKNGFTKVGEHSPWARLSSADILAIHEMLSEGSPIKQIASAFRVSEAYISQIGSRTVRRHDQPPKEIFTERDAGINKRGSKNNLAKLKESDIPVIRSLLSDGLTKTSISKMYGVHRKTILLIAKGETWEHV